MNSRLFKTICDLSADLNSQTKSHDKKSFHVAFAIHKNRIIAIGLNNFEKGHPICKDFKGGLVRGIHAEASLIARLKCRHINIKHEKLDVVVIRYSRSSNTLKNSKPCSDCAYLLGRYRFKNVWFSDYNGKLTKLER